MNRFPPKPATPDNWHKITHTTTQQNSIGEEIQKAPAKSTIILPPGDYYENLEIKKDIHLVGEGSTIINALPSGDPITIDGANVFLEHLTIQTGNSQCASPINLIGGTIIVEKCNIISSFMPAITIHKEGRLYFNECTITSNMMPIIYTNNSIKIEFQKCTISAPKSIGIVATNFSQVRFVESKITGCGDSGIVVMNSASLSVDKSVIENNAGDAIELNTDSLSNTILNTTITNHESGSAINCSGKGRLRIEKCKISKCVSGFFGSNEFNINSTQCEILDMISSALIYAIKKSVINLNGDILSGKCLSGIISDHQSSVKCEQVTLSDIETTGAFVSGNSLLKMNKCKVENIGQIAIESTEASTIEITDTDIEKVGKIGVLLDKNSKGLLANTKICKCGETCVYINDNQLKTELLDCSFEGSTYGGRLKDSIECEISKCEFKNNSKNGFETKGNANIHFNECEFSNNKEIGFFATEDTLSVFKVAILIQTKKQILK